MCHLYDLARDNMPWLEDWLWLCLAMSAVLGLAGFALWALVKEGGGGMRPGWAVICDRPDRRRPRLVMRCHDEAEARREATRLNLAVPDVSRPLYFPEYMRASSVVDIEASEQGRAGVEDAPPEPG